MSVVTSKPTWQMNTVTTKPATGSAQGLPEGDADEPGQRASGGESIRPRVPGIADQGGGLDAATNPQLVPGYHLIADDAGCGRGDPGTDVAGALVRQQLVNALDAGERRARPDHQRHTESGEVLGTLPAVGVALRSDSTAQPATEKDDGAGGHVRQVV
jgi:hypothetical protein